MKAMRRLIPLKMIFLFNIKPAIKYANMLSIPMGGAKA